MSVFNATFSILKKNIGTLLIALSISLGISFVYPTSTSPNPELEKINIVIFNEDQGNTAKHLENYIEKRMNTISLENKQDVIDDALFFGKVDYVLTIPATFSKTIKQNKKPDLTIQVKPDSFNQVYVDSIINNYLSTYQFYQEAFPEKNEEDITELTNQNLKTTGQITFDSSSDTLKKNTATGKVFGILAYTMFMTIFSAISLVSLAFNKKEIKLRNSCSPFSKRRFSRQLFLVLTAFCLIIWVLFIVPVLTLTNSNFDQHSLYFVLNTLLLFIVSISFSNFIGGVIDHSNMISAINNVFILGSAFLSGVFVPSEILPDVVTKIASFTPTYWYMNNCTLIGNTVQFNEDFLAKFQFNAFILLLFTVIFFLLTMITKRENGGLKFSFFKRLLEAK